MTEGATTLLERLIKTIHNKKVFIQTHNYPDQDAIASAFGLKELLGHYGIDSVICYQGQIDKVNTITMVEVLGIDLHDVDDIEMTSNDEIIIVDGQKGNVNVQELLAKEIACIDHHPRQMTDEYMFYDIRMVGACSSMIAQYFIENHVPVSERVATALVYGIKMDTANLMRQSTVLDVDMFCEMYKRSNLDMLRRFESNTLALKDLNAYQQALKNLRIYENHIGIADVGVGCSEAMMGTLSDFIMSLGEVAFSVVFSFRAGGLKISLRSEMAEYDASEVIKRALEGIAGGGGGHAGMAAGFIPNLTQREAFDMEKLLTDRIAQVVEQMRTNR